MDEQKTIRLTKEEERYFNELYNAYFNYVVKIIKCVIYSQNTDDITSCCQDVFFLAAQKIRTVGKYSSPQKWLAVTAINISRNFNRKNKINIDFTSALEDYDFMESDENIEILVTENIVFNDLIRGGIIIELWKSMSEREKQLYNLKYRKKLENEEISELLKVSEDTIRATLSRIRQKVEKHISRYH